jgi:uncharacterized protein YutE (UPF0331/DUF86 family)
LPRFDEEKLIRLISELRKSVHRLREHATLQKGLFISDPDKSGSAKYNFIVAIEACIDISNHIISQNGLRAPEDYADTFTVMEEAGVVDEMFATRLRAMAKFRNRLVHIYWEVDDETLYDILQSNLEDFGQFLRSLDRYLGLENKKES